MPRRGPETAGRRRLGTVQQAILDHVKGLEPKARVTTQELVKAIQKATGKRTVSKTSLFGGIKSLRKSGLIAVRKVGRELRIGAAAPGSAVAGAGSAVKTVAKRVATRARALAARAPPDPSTSRAAPEAVSPPSPIVGAKLAPGESLILHVEKDVVHVLENVHGRVEHRKVSRKG